MKLLSKLTIGKLELPNRVIMAPLTRSRALEGGVPQELNALYYAQRASAGLIISEATVIEPMGFGFLRVPGIFTKEQISGWRKVTDAVHDTDGRIFCQLWHMGRISHPSFLNGLQPVAPSPINAGGQIRTISGLQDKVTPRELSKQEIKTIVQYYTQAAINAVEARFDGVELHGANGYLIDQFLCDGSNQRIDEYGGSLPNRFRFLKEIIESVLEKVDNDKVGLRLSPSGLVNGMFDSNPVATFEYIISHLNIYNLAYLHLMEPYMPIEDNTYPEYLREPIKHFSAKYSGKIITNSGYTPDKAEAVLNANLADAVSFGKLYISNPDLVNRIRNNKELAIWNTKTFYTEGEEGYTDYKFCE